MFGKAVSPLALIGVFVAVTAMVGASVLLSSNTATVWGTNVVDNTNAIDVTLTKTSTGTFYATDSDGVYYAWTVNVPEKLTGVTVTITISEWKDTPSYSDIESITGTVNGQTGTLTAVQSSWTAGDVANGIPATMTYTMTLPYASVLKGDYAGNLIIVYNAAGSYDVSVEASGTYA